MPCLFISYCFIYSPLPLHPSSFATLMSPPVNTQQVLPTQDQQPQTFSNFLSNLISLSPKVVQTPSLLTLLSSTQCLPQKTRSLCKAFLHLKGYYQGTVACLLTPEVSFEFIQYSYYTRL